MHGDLDHPPIVIEKSTDRLSLLMVGGIFLLAADLFTIHAPRHSLDLIMGWASLPLWIVGLIVLGFQMVWPDKLIIRTEGFEISALWHRTRFHPWADVSEFRFVYYSRTTRIIEFIISDRDKAYPNLLKWTGGLMGRRLNLGLSWEVDQESLLALMNDARRRWGPPEV